MIYYSKYSGSWYPENKNELEKVIQTYIDKVNIPDEIKKIDGIIAPHAGYTYSGQTAAYSYKTLIEMEYDTVIILAPSHRYALNKISTFNFSEILTPLGSLEVDSNINKNLLKNSSIFIDEPMSYINEHSFELQIPFLQYVSRNKKFKVLPMIVGDLSINEFKMASNLLKEILKNKKPIFVASSDFTHFGKSFGYFPFKQDIEKNINKLDQESFDYILNLKIQDFFNFLNKTGITICGRNPILLLMNILSDHQVKLLYYTSSGKLTGDFNHSVSYASIVFGKK